MPSGAIAAEDACAACHQEITPNVVLDWQASKHPGAEVGCADCHGAGHTSADDVAAVETVTPATCATCHEEQFNQYSKGKHALGRASFKAMPTTHALPMALNQGMKGCGGCHSENFARAELAKGDDMIRGIASLYADGVLPKPEGYAHPFPDLLTFHDAPTTVEQRLFEMHLKHRMRAFQGTFHANPDYALWYGWSEMVRDLSEIREAAAALRAMKKE